MSDTPPALPSIANIAILDLLKSKAIPYEICAKPLELHGSIKVLRAELLLLDEELLLAILPAMYYLNLMSIKRILKKNTVFNGHNLNPGAPLQLAPIPGFYNYRTIIESDIFNEASIIVPLENQAQYIQITSQDFAKISTDFSNIHFSYLLDPSMLNYNSAEALDFKPNLISIRVKSRLANTFELPPIPAMVDEILKLRVDPRANANELARIIEKDPSLSAQIISWAMSPYYGFKGQLSSISEAIVKVLGYDMVMNFALGIALSHTLKIPMDGPLGLKTHWQDALYLAALIDKIILNSDESMLQFRGLGYLAGLLHNFGYLLLAHLFPAQFNLLQESLVFNKNLNRRLLENEVLGMGHDELGAWLMHLWRMPNELVMATRWHHYEQYTGPGQIYAHLIYLANALLAPLGHGEAENGSYPESFIMELKVYLNKVPNIISQFQEEKIELDNLVGSLVR